MTAVADPTLHWAVLARSRGEILTAEAQSPGLHLGLLGVPPGFSAHDAETWLYDIIGVAHEGSPEPEDEGHIPPLLRHALTGLLFSHAELWDRDGRHRPLSFAFAHTVDEVGFGYVGEAPISVWVDGEPFEPRWVTVRDEGGREARGWSVPSDRSVQVHIGWRPGAGEDGAEVEAVWTAVRQAATSAGPEPIPAEPADPASVESVTADAMMQPATEESAVARWL